MLRIGNSVWLIVGDPKTLGEYHGTHEIVLDQEITIALKYVRLFLKLGTKFRFLGLYQNIDMYVASLVHCLITTRSPPECCLTSR